MSLIAALILASSPDTLWVSGKFYRTLAEKADTETVVGLLYAQPGRSFFLEVTSPVHQIVTLKADTLILYYPEDRLAFKIRSNLRILPFGSQIFTFDAQKFLQKTGFIFLNEGQRGDSIWSYWSQPKQQVTLQVLKIRDKLHSIALVNNRGHPLFMVEVQKYKNLGNGEWMPVTVRSVDATGPQPVVEKVKFQALKITSQVPSWVQNFTLPKETDIRIQGWE